MRKGLLASYVSGITDFAHGERYATIIRYFIPEFITALVFYSLPVWVEANFISHLKSTPTYATYGATSLLIHLLMKTAEAFSVGAVVLSGRFNGSQDYKEVGRSVRDAFWVTFIIGLAIASVLYLGAHWIYYFLGVPTEIIALGVPFLRLRAVSIFGMFIYLAFVGFLRGIKNTQTPMHIFVLGMGVLFFFEYALMFGKFGFPELGFQGLALATVIQYSVMILAVVLYILFNPINAKYEIKLFSVFQSPSHIKELLRLSWPVVIDKATLAMAYLWLLKMIAPMGTCMVATYNVIKDMERFAFAPAIAFASVITFLVSNDFGKENWLGIKSNLKKVMFMASFMVFIILAVFAMMPEFIIGLFDKKGDFIYLAARAFPIVSVLAFFDLIQVVLSGALRGASNVKTVMMVRLLACTFFFVPCSYMVSLLPIADPVLKFIMIYATFYISNALMSVVYINRFRSEAWKTKSI